jgi:hypothetical protein
VRWHANYETKPPQQRLVELTTLIRRQNRKTAEILGSLEEIIDLAVGVAVVAVLHLGASTKKGFSFVEKEDRASCLGSIEHSTNAFLRFANVFADDAA